MDVLTCLKCGDSNLPSSRFCQNCGEMLSARSESTVEPKGGLESGSPIPSNIRARARDKEPDDPITVVIRRTAVGPSAQALAPQVEQHIVCFETDIGLSHRVNQDAGGAWTCARSDGIPASLLVVADGVSAGRQSEEASKLTVNILRDRLTPLLEAADVSMESVLAELLEATKEANAEVVKRPHFGLAGADATTIVAAICIGGEGGGIWCGDSRVYKVTPAGCICLTRDHSWAEQVVRSGLLTAEQAAVDPRAHMITRWLGPPGADDPGIEVFRFAVQPGDIIMCCTDGLYRYFPHTTEDHVSEMASSVYGESSGLHDRVRTLVDTALERGGRDDITLAVLRAVGPRGAEESITKPQEESSASETTLRLKLPPVVS